jgi:hypothetical protein
MDMHTATNDAVPAHVSGETRHASSPPVRSRMAGLAVESAECGTGPRRLSSVQAARGVAALAVVVTHSIAHPLEQQHGVVFLLGLYGVALFFAISGYPRPKPTVVQIAS